jgi:hypothetical protein
MALRASATTSFGSSLGHAKAASDRAEGELSAVEDDDNLRPEVRDELGKTASALEELVSALSAEIGRRRTSPR